MINHTLAEFWRYYESLPLQVQREARRAFKFFKENPFHPSLHFKELKGFKNVYSVRVGSRYRAVARRDNEVLYWFWIGSHSEFDKQFS